MTDATISDHVAPTSLSSTKSVLVTAAEVVVFLFAAFNGYLKVAAPPAGRVGGMSGDAAVGFASFGALLVFLFAKTWIPARYSAPTMQKAWLSITFCLVLAYFGTGFFYQSQLDRYTFFYPLGNPTRREVLGVKRTAYGDSVFRFLQSQGDREPLAAELIRSIGDPPNVANTKLWDAQSIQDAQNSLVYAYVAFIVVLASAIASLIELQLLANPQAGSALPEPEKPPEQPDQKKTATPAA